MVPYRGLLIALALPLWSVNASAQESLVAPRRLGIVVGVNRANFSEIDRADPRTGLLLGAQLYASVGRRVGIQPELLFSMKGATIDQGSIDVDFRMNYLELPVLFRYDLTAVGAAIPFLYAGPSFAYQWSCDVTTGNASSSCEEYMEAVGAQAEFNTFDVGAVVGGGLAFETLGRPMTVGARYTHGFSKVASDADDRHRVLSFLVSMHWAFGGR